MPARVLQWAMLQPKARLPREARTTTEAREAERESAKEPASPVATAGEPDYYAVLGLAPGASPAELRRAYRRLAKLWHPDRYVAAPPELRARAERRMRTLNEAYAVLGDKDPREDYDQRHGAPPEPDDRATGFSPPPPGFSWMPPGYAAPRPAPLPPHPASNPNGAGEFFGLLCVILAFSLLVGTLQGGVTASGVGLFFGFGLALVLLVGAGLLFTSDSALVRLAHHWAEGEPRGPQPNPSAARAAAPPADDDAEAFEQLVDEALASIPASFLERMPNLLVDVQAEPSLADLRRAGVPPGHTLLGLYTGVPLTRQGLEGATPEIVTIYRRPIERYCGGDADRIREQVRRTVLHEIAHHFGIDHDEMPSWVK